MRQRHSTLTKRIDCWQLERLNLCGAAAKCAAVSATLLPCDPAQYWRNEASFCSHSLAALFRISAASMATPNDTDAHEVLVKVRTFTLARPHGDGDGSMLRPDLEGT